MGYSIELYFEREFEDKLRLLWEALDKYGVPSILHKIGSRPHLSLSILDKCDTEQIARIIAPGIEKNYPFPITFPAIKTLEIFQNSSAIGKTWVTEIGFIEFRPRKVIRTMRLTENNA